MFLWVAELEMMDPNFIKKLTGFLILPPLVQALGRGMLSVPPILIPFNSAAGSIGYQRCHCNTSCHRHKSDHEDIKNLLSVLLP